MDERKGRVRIRSGFDGDVYRLLGSNCPQLSPANQKHSTQVLEKT